MIIKTIITKTIITKTVIMKIRMMLRLLTASIAEVVSIAVSPPERGRGGPTVHTLSTLCEKNMSQTFFTIRVSLRGCLLVGCKQKVLDESPRSREGENGIVATPPEREKSPPPERKKI